MPNVLDHAGRIRDTRSRVRWLAAVAAVVMCMAGVAGLEVSTAGPAQAAGFGSGTPGFAVYPAPTSLNNSNNAGIDWNTGLAGHGTVMYQAFSSTYRVAFDDATVPATVSWTDTNAPNVINLDPILATDRVTGRTWAGGLATSCGQLAFTDNDGAPWTPTVPCIRAA